MTNFFLVPESAKNRLSICTNGPEKLKLLAKKVKAIIFNRFKVQIISNYSGRRCKIMARITVEDCLSRIGNENRFMLIHLAVSRVKQHRNGQQYLVKGKNKEAVMSLREIAAGKVNFDNIADFNKKTAAEKKVIIEPSLDADA